jgi:hypothetical protein
VPTHELSPPTTASVPGPPPPPPAARRREDRGSRATAATWVAATGALLLLAAAGTFLAVAWDTMGLPARVAVVAAVTGAAILGGHRLRTILPAVGAVVFHLGALLVPVDVLGLALQLEVAPAGRWLATGGSALVAFAILAVTGRSKVLAWAAVAAAPVTATGVGLATAIPAVLALVIGAGLALALAAAVGALRPLEGPSRGEPDAAMQVFRFAGPVLAVTAVYLPLVVLVVAGLVTTEVGRDLDSAGWTAAWDATLGTGIIAAAVLAIGATRLRSTVLAVLVPISATVTALLMIGPDSTPELVVLLAFPVLASVVELVALVTVRDVFWARVTRVAAGVVEVVAAVAVPLAAVAILAPWPLDGSHTEPELALASAVIGVAWAFAVARRTITGGWRRDVVVAGAGAVVLHGIATVVLLAPATGLRPWLALGAAALSLIWVPSAMLRVGAVRGGTVQFADGWPGAIALAIGGVMLAMASVWTSAQVVSTALVAVLILGWHVRGAAAAATGDAAAALAVLLPATVTTILLAASAPGAAGLPAAARAVVVVGLLLALAAVAEPVPVGADLVRAVAAVVALAAPLGGWVAWDLDLGQRAVLAFSAAHAGAIAVTVLGVVWLAVDAVRLQRPWLLALAAPIALRGALSTLLVLGVSVEVMGLVVLAAAGLATVAAAAEVGRWRLAAGVFATIAVPTGWLLLGDDPAPRAWVTVALGAVVVAAGLLRRQPLLGHLGGIVMTLGVWWLLALEDVTAAELWVLPVAAQLWGAGLLARHRGTSSWLTDVPPLLLVAVPALAERLVGGPGWHTVLAGGIGVLAVAGGGARRLGGPLIVGSVILASVAVVETLAVVASVPTWAWLALAGAVLLGTAVAIERSGASPVASARRLVEVIDERFD